MESGPVSVALSLVPMPEQNWMIQLRFTGVKDLSIAKMSADGIRCALFEVTRLDQSGRQASRFPDADWMVGDFKTDAIAFFAMTAEVMSIEKTGDKSGISVQFIKTTMSERIKMSEQLLVSTQWLAEHLSDRDLRIVDIRGHVIPASEPPPHYFNHQADYQKSHIPGAVFVDWIHEITDPDDPRHAQIAKPDRFAAVMSRLGIAPETMAVVYDDAKGMFAARLWWALNYYGHHRVAVLDGGWQKWIAEQLPTNAALPDVEPTHFVPRIDASWRRTGDQVLRALNTNTPLVDVRTPEEFAGASSRAKRKGHIPGAANLSRTDLLAPDGTMLPAGALRQKFEQAGVDESTPETILYCNSGISASYGLLAMKVAGLESGTVYDGSWKDWGNDDSKPIEK